MERRTMILLVSAQQFLNEWKNCKPFSLQSSSPFELGYILAYSSLLAMTIFDADDYLDTARWVYVMHVWAQDTPTVSSAGYSHCFDAGAEPPNPDLDYDDFDRKELKYTVNLEPVFCSFSMNGSLDSLESLLDSHRPHYENNCVRHAFEQLTTIDSTTPVGTSLHCHHHFMTIKSSRHDFSIARVEIGDWLSNH